MLKIFVSFYLKILDSPAGNRYFRLRIKQLNSVSLLAVCVAAAVSESKKAVFVIADAIVRIDLFMAPVESAQAQVLSHPSVTRVTLTFDSPSDIISDLMDISLIFTSLILSLIMTLFSLHLSRMIFRDSRILVLLLIKLFLFPILLLFLFLLVEVITLFIFFTMVLWMILLPSLFGLPGIRVTFHLGSLILMVLIIPKSRLSRLVCFHEVAGIYIDRVAGDHRHFG